MKRYAIVSILLFLVLGKSGQAAAQAGEMRLNLFYNYSKPLSDFKTDMISKGSLRGGSGELMYGISRTLSAGIGVAFQDYYQKYPRGVYPLDKDENISAVLTNSVQTTPIMARLSYTPLGNHWLFVQPYISAGAGLNLVNYRQYLGQYESTDASAGFIAQVVAGLQVPFGRLSSSGAILGATYNYAPYKRYGFTNLNSLNFQAGIYVPLR